MGKYAGWRMYDMGDISADQIRTDDSDAKATSQMIMRLIRLSHFYLDQADVVVYKTSFCCSLLRQVQVQYPYYT